jgi:hypothetical protein
MPSLSPSFISELICKKKKLERKDKQIDFAHSLPINVSKQRSSVERHLRNRARNLRNKDEKERIRRKKERKKEKKERKKKRKKERKRREEKKKRNEDLQSAQCCPLSRCVRQFSEIRE